MKKLFLFDIDGTLISPSNIARKLLDKILIDQFGKSPNLKYEDVAGSTDLIIIENALRKIDCKTNLNETVDKVLNIYIKKLKLLFEESKKPFVYKDTIKLLDIVIKN